MKTTQSSTERQLDLTISALARSVRKAVREAEKAPPADASAAWAAVEHRSGLLQNFLQVAGDFLERTATRRPQAESEVSAAPVAEPEPKPEVPAATETAPAPKTPAPEEPAVPTAMFAAAAAAEVERLRQKPPRQQFDTAPMILRDGKWVNAA